MNTVRFTGNKKTCSRCHQEHDGPNRYCRSCHAAYMREWRADRKTRFRWMVKKLRRLGYHAP